MFRAESGSYRVPLPFGVTPQQPDKERTTDEGGYDPDGKFERRNHGARDQISGNGKAGSNQSDRRQTAPMIRSNQEADNMGHDQSDKTDHSGYSHHHPGQGRRQNEHRLAKPVHVEPESSSALVTSHEQIEPARLKQHHAQSDNHCG